MIDSLVRFSYLSFNLIGIGLFCGMVFPCLNGPFNVLKTLREKIGKPFACPVCSLLWGIVISALISMWVPMMVYMILGAAGWGILIMHITGYQIIYQGMEDE